jgi:transposase
MEYTMNTKELARLTVIKGAVDGAYTVRQAALKLGVSTRQVKRLKKDVREQGGGAVIHGNSGRHPANATGGAIRAKTATLKKSGAYRQANFAHFRELLEENEQIKISYTSLSDTERGRYYVSQDTPQRGRKAGKVWRTGTNGCHAVWLVWYRGSLCLARVSG